jgi:sec-independent protein translocase protein TatA
MPGGPELIIILVVVLVLFGGSQLPKLAKNLGKAQKEFKDGMGEATATPPAAAPPAAAAPPPPPAAPASAPSDETK